MPARRAHARDALKVLLPAVLAVLLLGHGAVHLWWLAPPSAEAAALVDPHNAWVVARGFDAGLLRATSLVLAPAIMLLYAASAAGTMGWLLRPDAWRRTTLAASLLSLLLLTPYFHPSGWVGFVVDAALILALPTPLAARLGIPRPRRRTT